MTLHKGCDGKEYNVVNGVFYHSLTPVELITQLEHARANRIRIRVFHGYTSHGYCATGDTKYKNGEAWGEEHDVLGYVGTTTGQIKSPLLVYNARSHGGGIINGSSIVAVKTAGAWLWKDKNFTVGQWGLIDKDNSSGKYEVAYNGEVHARFDTEAQAERYIDFMIGKRFTR